MKFSYLDATEPKSLPWTNEFFENYQKIDLEDFSMNQGFRWTEEFIIKNEEYLHWGALSENPSLPWSEELIFRFKDKWDVLGLSMNSGIKWTSRLIEAFKDDLDWGILSLVIDAKNFDEILKSYSTKFLWYRLGFRNISFGLGLSGNKNLFREFFENLSIQEIVDILFECKIEKENCDVEYLNIQESFENKIWKLKSTDDREDYKKSTSTFDDDPNYDPESDFDQQGPDFDF